MTKDMLLAYVKNSKYLVLTLLFFVILLIIIFSIIIVPSTNQTGDSPAKITPTQSMNRPTITIVSPTQSQLTNTQLLQQIRNETQPQLDRLITVPYTVSKIKTYGDDWAIVQVTNPTTDPANSIIKKENNNWVVIMGPGTFFEAAELRPLGVPQSLIDEINTNL